MRLLPTEGHAPGTNPSVRRCGVSLTAKKPGGKTERCRKPPRSGLVQPSFGRTQSCEQRSAPTGHTGHKKFNSRLVALTILLASLFCGSFLGFYLIQSQSSVFGI